MIGWVKTATGSLDAGLLALAGFPLLAAVLLATNRLSAAPR